MSLFKSAQTIDHTTQQMAMNFQFFCLSVQHKTGHHSTASKWMAHIYFPFALMKQTGKDQHKLESCGGGRRKHLN